MADDIAYARRRIDQLMDDRLETIEEQQVVTNKKIDRLEARLNWLFGGLAVLSFVMNVFGPAIVERLVGK